MWCKSWQATRERNAHAWCRMKNKPLLGTLNAVSACYALQIKRLKPIPSVSIQSPPKTVFCNTQWFQVISQSWSWIWGGNIPSLRWWLAPLAVEKINLSNVQWNQEKRWLTEPMKISFGVMGSISPLTMKCNEIFQTSLLSNGFLAI